MFKLTKQKKNKSAGTPWWHWTTTRAFYPNYQAWK